MIPYRESSAILELFTPNQGVIPVMAHSGRRPTSPYVSAIRTLIMGKFVLYFSGRGDFYHLREVEIIAGPEGIVQDEDKFFVVSVVSSLILKLAPARTPNYSLYRIINDLIQKLSKTSDRDRIVTLLILSIINLLKGSGYLPPLDSCARCGSPEIRFFSVAGGGSLCLQHGRTGIKLNQEMVKVMKDLEQNRDLSSLPILRKVLDLILEYYRYHIDEPDPVLASAIDWLTDKG